MLSEIANLCKRTKEWLKINEKDLFLSAVIVLVAAISFGLGRLSKIREEKTPITIETNNLTPNSLLSTSNVNSGKNSTSAKSMSDIDFAENKSVNDKIFVASRNGKKYYYAWCESAKIIKEQNRVWFSTKEEAEKSGYEPATNCRGLK